MAQIRGEKKTTHPKYSGAYLHPVDLRERGDGHEEVAQAILEKSEKSFLSPCATVGIDRWHRADIRHALSCPPPHQN
jgi:hypothetical protein